MERLRLSAARNGGKDDQFIALGQCSLPLRFHGAVDHYEVDVSADAELVEDGGDRRAGVHLQLRGGVIEDDHLALNRAGIPAVDIIDFSYRHWHRLSDVPKNCSGESLEQVARVLSVWLQRVK